MQLIKVLIIVACCLVTGERLSAQAYSVRQTTNNCADLELKSAEVQGDNLIVTMRVLNPDETQYYVRDVTLSTNIGVVRSTISITNKLESYSVGWHKFVLRTNRTGVTNLFRGVEQKTAVQVRVEKPGSDLLWFGPYSTVLPSAFGIASSVRDLFGGGCLLVSNSVAINAANPVAGSDLAIVDTVDGMEQGFTRGLIAQAVDQANNLLVFNPTGSLLSYNPSTGETNWIHAYASRINLIGNPIAVDEHGFIHVAGRSVDASEPAQLHHVINPLDGHTMVSDMGLPRISGLGGSMAIGSDGRIFGVEGASAMFGVIDGLGSYGILAQGAYDRRGGIYFNYGKSGLGSYHSGLIIRAWPVYEEFALVREGVVVGSQSPTVFGCYSFVSGSFLWSSTNSANSIQVPGLLSQQACVYLTTNGLAITETETGRELKLLSDSKFLVTGVRSNCRFAVDDRGILVVACEFGVAAYDVRDFIDPDFVRHGNGCWHRFGANGRNDQRQAKVVPEHGVLAVNYRDQVSRFTGTGPEGEIYVADRLRISRLDSGLTNIAWQISERGIASEIIVDGEFLFTCGRDGYLRKRHRENGELAWEVKHPDRTSDGDPVYFPYRTSFAAADSRLFTVDDHSRLACWSKDDGRLLWSRYLVGVVVGRLALTANGQLFLATTEGNVLSIDAASGRIQWQSYLGDGAYPHLGVGFAPNGRLVLPLYDGQVLFLDPFTGERLKSSVFPGALVSLPLFDTSGAAYGGINSAAGFGIYRLANGNDAADALFSASGVLSGPMHLLGNQRLLVSLRTGMSYLIPTVGGQAPTQLDTFSKTSGGWRHLDGNRFLMDGARLQVREIDPVVGQDSVVSASDGSDDNTHFWRSIQIGIHEAPVAQRNAYRGDEIVLLAPIIRSDVIGYQWTFNGTLLEGATNYFLSVTNAVAAQSGIYGVTVRTATETADVSVATVHVADGVAAGHLNWIQVGHFHISPPVVDDEGNIAVLQPSPAGLVLAGISRGDGAIRFSTLVSTNQNDTMFLPAGITVLSKDRFFVRANSGAFDLRRDSNGNIDLAKVPSLTGGGWLSADHDGNLVLFSALGNLSRYDTSSLSLVPLGTNKYIDAVVLPGNEIAALGRTNIDFYSPAHGDIPFVTLPLPDGVSVSHFENVTPLSLDERARLLVRLRSYSSFLKKGVTRLTVPPTVQSINSVLVSVETALNYDEYSMLTAVGGQKVYFSGKTLYSIDAEAGDPQPLFVADTLIMGLASNGQGMLYVATLGEILGLDATSGAEKWRIDLPISMPNGDLVGAPTSFQTWMTIEPDGTLLVQAPDSLLSIYTGATGIGPGWLTREGDSAGRRQPLGDAPAAAIIPAANGVRITTPGIVPGPYTIGVSEDLFHWQSSLLIVDPQSAANGIEVPVPEATQRFFRIR